MRIETLRIKILNGHLFAQRSFSMKRDQRFFNKNYSDYKEYKYDTKYIDSIWDHKSFSSWYNMMEGTQLIPAGWRGNELRFRISNNFNSKSWS
jgi:hypothetical protein